MYAETNPWRTPTSPPELFVSFINLGVTMNNLGVSMNRVTFLIVAFAVLCFHPETNAADRDLVAGDEALFDQATSAIILACNEFANRASTRGGYVYRSTLDGKKRWGEGEATPTEIWVPATRYPDRRNGVADRVSSDWQRGVIVSCQCSGGGVDVWSTQVGTWADRVDFDPKGKRSDLYRNGQGNPKGRNYSTLDDDKSQAAIRFLIEMDKARPAIACGNSRRGRIRHGVVAEGSVHQWGIPAGVGEAG